MIEPGDRTAALAISLLEARRPHDALTQVRQGLASAPDDPLLHAVHAAVLLDLGDRDGALDAAHRALAIDPSLGWAHELRARALLRGGDADEAVAAATEAVRLDPTSDQGWYLLSCAELQAGDRRAAATHAEGLRRRSPGSVLGPIALARVDLDGVRVFERRSPAVWVAIAVLTSGTALVIWAVLWCVRVLRRAPALRRADGHIHDALRLDPASAYTRVLAAEVLALRLRFVRSIDHDLAAASIDAGLVDARELAARIGRREATAAALIWLGWLTPVVVLDELVDATVPVAVSGFVLGVVALTGAVAFVRSQRRPLPVGVARLVRGRIGLAVAAVIVAVWAIGAGFGFDPDAPAAGYLLAALTVSPLAVAAAGWVVWSCVGARRA